MPLSNEEIQSKISHHTLELTIANARLSQLIKSPNYDQSSLEGETAFFAQMLELSHLIVYHFDLRLSFFCDLKALEYEEL